MLCRKKGKITPANKISDERLDFVRENINSFPRVPGHYTRQDSNREYLVADLNITKLYKLYEEKCTACGRDPVKMEMHRKVFSEEYNISFHIPKKDQCNLCTKYRNANDGTLTENLKQDWSWVSVMHYMRKLCVYNLSVYCLGGKVSCFIWTETNGMRGSSETTSPYCHSQSKYQND